MNEDVKNKMDVLKDKTKKIYMCKKESLYNLENIFIYCQILNNFSTINCDLYDVNGGDLLYNFVKSVCIKYSKQFK